MHEAKAIVKAFVCIAIGCLPLWLIGVHVYEATRLAYAGTTSTGYIVSYDPQRCGRRKYHIICHRHTVYIDGRKQQFDLGREYATGTSVLVTYMPNEPTIAKLGALNDDPLRYLKSQIGLSELFGIAVGLFFWWTGIQWLLSVRPKNANPTS